MPMIGLFSGLNISATGLRAQRVRQNVIASNLANAETTRTPEGGPYKRQSVVLSTGHDEKEFRAVFPQEQLEGWNTQKEHLRIPGDRFPIVKENIGTGVKVDAIEEDGSDARLVYDPTHPDANTEGYVAYPNINVVKEMTDMISATRAYEANVTAASMTKSMLAKAMEL